MSEASTDGTIRFSSPDGLPAEYKDLLVRMLSIQSRIESEYMLAADRTLMKPLALAPTPEDKAEYAAFWSDEVRHASYWMKLLDELGVKVDDKFMASPMPIYIFEMRDQAEEWIDYGLFSFFADRQGAYMGYEWVGCSYEPLARIAERVHKEELGHAAFGYRLMRRYLQREGDRGRENLIRHLAKWYPAGLDMFGKSGSKRQFDYVRWGLRRRTNEQMRDEFTAEVNNLLTKLDIPIPDPAAGRRFS
ncbi:MAG TPA: Phenylacetic acid catabolic protein [Candidatus Acidoferrales bacterium]|nr:Phenylacetic acid catabolic protein [Candidatus Acidoferrales bacterium]